MKTISKLVFSVVAVVGFSTACYAHEECLNCCTGASCPTKQTINGVPGMILKAFVPKVKVDGVTYLREGVPGYEEWADNIVATKSEEEAGRLLDASMESVTIYARCIGSSIDERVNISKPNASITCPSGVGIELRQHSPKCKDPTDPTSGPQSVVEITKQTPEEHIAKEQQGLYDLLDQREVLREQIQQEDAHFDKLNREILSSGLLETIAQDAANKSSVPQKPEKHGWFGRK